MHPIANYDSFHRLSQNYRAFTSNLSSVLLPKTIQEALGHIEWRTVIIIFYFLFLINKWRTIIMEEMNALKKKK